METTLAVVSGLGVVGVAILGIMYGLAAREVGDLMARLALTTASGERAVDDAAALRRVLYAKTQYIAALERKLLDATDPAELARLFNGLLQDGSDRDDN